MSLRPLYHMLSDHRVKPTRLSLGMSSQNQKNSRSACNSRRKIRRPNFSNRELEVMITCIETNTELVRCVLGMAIPTHMDRRKCWEKVAQAVNQVGGNNRTWKELNDKWLDLKCKTRAKAVSISEGKRGAALNRYEERILMVLFKNEPGMVLKTAKGYISPLSVLSSSIRSSSNHVGEFVNEYSLKEETKSICESNSSFEEPESSNRRNITSGSDSPKTSTRLPFSLYKKSSETQPSEPEEGFMPMPATIEELSAESFLEEPPINETLRGMDGLYDPSYSNQPPPDSPTDENLMLVQRGVEALERIAAASEANANTNARMLALIEQRQFQCVIS